jgi:hypothetical protein
LARSLPCRPSGGRFIYDEASALEVLDKACGVARLAGWAAQLYLAV